MFTGSEALTGIITGVAIPYLDHPRPAAFAHRGGAAHNPENSWSAFEYAVKLGYAYLETDARSTSDGALFNIDLKDSGTIEPMVRVLKRTAAWDRVCVTSFSGQRLVAARKILDRPVCMAVTPAAVAAVRYAGFSGKRMAARLARSGAQCAQVPRQIATREFIRRSHELGLHVHVWTLNTRAEIEHALDLGADGVMTDNIVLLRDILTERGQWNPRVAVLRAYCDPKGPQVPETSRKRGWRRWAWGILSGCPVLPIEIANRLGGSKYGRTRTTRNPTRRDQLRERP